MHRVSYQTLGRGEGGGGGGLGEQLDLLGVGVLYCYIRSFSQDI